VRTVPAHAHTRAMKLYWHPISPYSRLVYMFAVASGALLATVQGGEPASNHSPCLYLDACGCVGIEVDVALVDLYQGMRCSSSSGMAMTADRLIDRMWISWVRWMDQ